MSLVQKINPKIKLLFPVAKGLAKALGKDYEVNLHDVSMLEHSIVLIENGHVTGRSVGSPMTDFGLVMLKSPEYKDKEGVFNYLAKNNRGELIKCNCIFIRDENGKIIAFLCINYNLNKALAAREVIENLLKVDMGVVEKYSAENDGSGERRSEPVRESFAQDFEEVIGESISEAIKTAGKPLKFLTKAEKQQVIKELSDKGFFLLKGSVERLAEEFGNTKFTVYAYIRQVQKTEEGK